ncbi:LysR family transcriptional regulator [Vibrio sp. ZSDE26]|uniref:LysR family transcriptional regulator n=1 Tax=Vibrio amylolyticus TaxID=2847292 RepID=A0A9X1XJT3_9VIBR|nr:LysR family transcriptional regulator [Vibrio amylolyticus]MCK6264287.1 LysR family transcriptional regulator [Vibrio amylolyticus]
MKNTIDLNLYRFLDLLFEQKSQVKVCHTLDISRATFNRHLSDCRDLFGNELFIATKGIYEPTLFTNQLIRIIKEPLEQLEQAQQMSLSFEGDDADIEYMFYVANPLSSLLTVPLLKGLTNKEFQPKVSFVDWSLEGVEFPKSGSLSIGIAGYPNDLNERLVERKVGTLSLYAYLSKSHPLANEESIELSVLSDMDTVRVSMGSLDDNSYYGRIHRRTGIQLNQKLTVASVHAALECIQVSPYLFICFNIMEDLMPESLKQVPLSLNGESMTFDIGMQFHRACYQHPVIGKIEKMISKHLLSIESE